MASSIDQQWPAQHQYARSMMDGSHRPYGQQYNHSPSQDPNSIDSSLPPNYIANVQNQNLHYHPNPIYPGHSVSTSSCNDPSGGHPGRGYGGQADYYQGDCGNLHSITAYSHGGNHSVTISTSALNDSAPLSSSHHHHHTPPAIIFTQPTPIANPVTTTTADQYYQEPYYLPASINYPADYQQQQDQYSQQQSMYSSYGQACEPPMAPDTQHPETDQAPVPRPADPTPTLAGPTTSSCCSSSSKGVFTSPELGSANGNEQPAAGANGHANILESTTLLDSTSNGRVIERKIKPKSNAQHLKQQQQQPEQLISSCHANRVRAGPLGIIARRKNATRETTAILKEWLDEHGRNPYPSKGEKIMLSCVTKMSMTQVSTWFANARRRMKKEKRFHWVASGGNSAAPSSSSGSTSGSSSLNKVKSEYAKAVMSSPGSSAGCPALKYFMQKHHRQMLDAAENAPSRRQQEFSATSSSVAKTVSSGQSSQQNLGLAVKSESPTSEQTSVAPSTKGTAHPPASAPTSSGIGVNIKREVVTDHESSSSSTSDQSSVSTTTTTSPSQVDESDKHC